MQQLLMRWSLVACTWIAFFAGGSVYAQATKVVIDNAGLFSEEAIKKATADFQQARKAGTVVKDLLIETMNKELDAPKSDPERDAFFQKLANQRAKDQDAHGIYVLITTNPRHLQVIVGKETMVKGIFTKTEKDELAKRMLARLGGNKDAALAEGVSYVIQHAQAVAQQPQAQPAPRPRPQSPAPAQQVEAPSWTSWVCIGLVVLLVVWVIVGIIKGIASIGRGNAGPGPGYGGGGYGGGGGGGGGGFMTGLMGGLFGAVAGSWLYNNFMGGGGSSAWGGSPGQPYYPPSNPSGTGDVGGDTSGGGGGDWGGGDRGDKGGIGGGDAGRDDDKGGGGGGDWGGKDAGGGGGDWGGGGGGDMGGGGGGDWGGGGGGDAGGGGGEW